MGLITFESEAYQRMQKANVELIRSLLKEETQAPEFGWMSQKQILEVLDASPRTLQNWRDQGLVGFSQIGKKIYYPQKQVEEMLQRHYQKPFRAVA